jgi:hypothetical protein
MRRLSRFPRGAAFCCLAVLGLYGAGCSGDGLNRAAVKGKVLVDNEPLDEGMISFFPVEGNAGPEAGIDIRDGAYNLPRKVGAIVGKNRVVIRGFRKTGRKIKDPFGLVQEEKVDAVPPEYNNNSTLVREIRPGDNTLDFELKGTKGKRQSSAGH